MKIADNFGSIEGIAVTVLVDNRADLLEESTDIIKRFDDEPLLAEHGFAVLIDLSAAGIRILWDAGISEIALMENLRRMKIEAASIDLIALSHGHGDHTAGITPLLKALDLRPKPIEWKVEPTLQAIEEHLHSKRIPIIAHPAAFREHWWLDDDGVRHGPELPAPHDLWQALGAQVILSEGTYQLGPGCWITGEVPRRSFEKSGLPRRLSYRQGDAFIEDRIEDDQAIAIHVAGKGLVVISGCAHAGIINTVEHARRISGVEQVYAVIGGFHLAKANDDEIKKTIETMQTLSPVVVSPTHCTGFRAMRAFAQAMPESFVTCVVGTTYLF